MAVYAESGRYFRDDVEEGLEGRYFAVVGLSLVAVNVFTFFYHLSDAAVFNAAGNTVSIALILYSVHAVLRSPCQVGADVVFLVVAGALAGASVLVNLSVASPIVTLKYLSIYIFYAAGRAWPGRFTRVESGSIFALAGLPLLFMLLGTSKVYSAESVAYLPNANTAVLYFSALLFAFAPRLGNMALLLQFINAALMNKVGAAVATAVAIGLWAIFPLRRASVLALAALVAGGVGAHMLGALDRLWMAYDHVVLIWSLEPATVASMSYKDLVELTGTTDLSAFFRVIHWANIWDLFSHNNVLVLLFGYGAGQTQYLAYAQLPPHNDYLRILVEYGPFNLIVFVAFLIYVALSIRPVPARILFSVLLIYMLSENLLDNFTSMAIYFAYAGRMAVEAPRLRRRERGKPVIGDEDVAWPVRAS